MTLTQVEIGQLYPWINHELILRNKEKFIVSGEEITIRSMNIESALAKGENFCSNLIRLTVFYSIQPNGRERRRGFVVKADIPNEAVEGYANEFNYFTKEICVYVDIMPRVEQMLQSIGVPDPLSPKCYGINRKPDYLLFEDLKETGFVMTSKSLGLDMQHLELLLPQLARWHAATAVLYITNPDLFQFHEKPLVSRDSPGIETLMRNILRATSKSCQNWEGFEQLSKKLSALEMVVFESACEAHARGGFTVLNHGDLWINNVMFKYSQDGRPVNVMLIDYALGALGSPAKDLTFLLYSSSHVSVRDSQWEQLIESYHNELISTLRRFNYPAAMPTLAQIKGDCSKCGIYNVLVVILIIGLRHLGHVHGDGIVGMMGLTAADEQYRIDLLSNPAAGDELRFLLNFFEQSGRFEL